MCKVRAKMVTDFDSYIRYIYIYVYMYIYMCVCIYVYVYMCIYVYVKSEQKWSQISIHI
jgi:hypothetical protein